MCWKVCTVYKDRWRSVGWGGVERLLAQPQPPEVLDKEAKASVSENSVSENTVSEKNVFGKYHFRKIPISKYHFRKILVSENTSFQKIQFFLNNGILKFYSLKKNWNDFCVKYLHYCTLLNEGCHDTIIYIVLFMYVIQ